MASYSSAIGIILLICVIIRLTFLFLNNDTAVSATQEKLEEVANLLEKQKHDLGRYPSDLIELIGIDPLRRGLDVDAWGRKFEYQFIDSNNTYILISRGEDGLLKTADDLRPN